jgi:DNA invertase Pin-like site-specific DNA recombinase
LATTVATKKLRVAAYCRVSTDKAEQLNSQENQVEYFNNRIAEAGHELAGIYPDEGVTGTSMTKRKEFLRMMADAGIDYRCVNPEQRDKRKRQFSLVVTDRAPKFDWIWVKNTSRFARNILAVDALEKLKAKGVNVYFVERDLSTDKDRDMWAITLFLSIDQEESRSKSEKVRFGHDVGARTGKMHTSGKIYGYTYDSKTKTLTAVPEEAEIIRFIFQLYSEGKGIRVILNHLKDKGYKTRAGKDFTKSSVARILENPKYCGTLVRNRWDTGKVFVDKHSPRKRAEAEWIAHEDREDIEPIVSKELYKACQEIREGKVNTQNQKGIYRGHSEYAGLIVCGKCGSSYTKNQDRGRVFYNCSKKKREGVAACDNPNVSLKELEEGIKQTGLFDFSEKVIKRRDERVAELWQARATLINRKDTDKEAAVSGFVAQVEALERGLDMLRRQAFKGNITEEEFERAHAEQAQEKQALLAQIEELRKDNDQIDADVRAIEAQVERLEAIDPEEWVMEWATKEKDILDEVKRIVIADPHGWGIPNVQLEYKIIDLINRSGESTEKAL